MSGNYASPEKHEAEDEDEWRQTGSPTPISDDDVGQECMDSEDNLDDSHQEMAGILDWGYLPSLLLEEVFGYLTIRQRAECSLVCKRWYQIVKSPRIWRHLVVKQDSFTYRRYNMYRGYEQVISHHQVQLYLGKVGHHLRRITIRPMADFYNLYEFIKVVDAFLRFFDVYPTPNLHRFDFTFSCEMRSEGESIVFGTGGQVLEELKQLLAAFRGLESLLLNDLLLDPYDAPTLLAGVADHCRQSLRRLELLNVSKEPFPHFYVAMFTELRTLVISPAQLTDDIVGMLANHDPLRQIVLVQDKYSCPCEAVSARAWQDLKKKLPYLRVRLELRGVTNSELLIQPQAPVDEVVYTSLHIRITANTLLQIIDNYKRTLRVYAHCGLPRKYGSRSFHERPDTYLVMLASSCPLLETLVVRERISTTTLLIIVSHARNLKHLFVRQNALLKKIDWPRAPQWTERFYSWLRKTAKSEVLVEQEISNLLGVPWNMLSDRWFKSIHV